MLRAKLTETDKEIEIIESDLIHLNDKLKSNPEVKNLE